MPDKERKPKEGKLLTRREEIALSKQICAGIEASKHIDAYKAGMERLSNKEVRTLKREVQRGINARDSFARANLGLVYKIAKHYEGLGVPYEDLVQEGRIALTKAVTRFDHTKGNRFSSYGFICIDGAMKKALTKQGHMIGRTDKDVSDVIKYRDAQNRLSQELDRDPAIEEMCDELGMDANRIRQLMVLSQELLSLEEPAGDDGNDRLIDRIEDGAALPPLAMIYSELEHEQATELLKRSLTKFEAEVVSMRYGLTDTSPYTVDEIAEHFNLTRERILDTLKDAHETLSEDLNQDLTREHTATRESS